MKLTKSRREYKCHQCKKTIKKGDLYKRGSYSVGKPWKPDEVERDEKGFVAFVAQGFKVATQTCEPCARKDCS